MTRPRQTERSGAKTGSEPRKQAAARAEMPESRAGRPQGATILTLPQASARPAAKGGARAQAGQTEQEAQLLGQYNLYNG